MLFWVNNILLSISEPVGALQSDIQEYEKDEKKYSRTLLNYRENSSNGLGLWSWTVSLFVFMFKRNSREDVMIKITQNSTNNIAYTKYRSVAHLPNTIMVMSCMITPNKYENISLQPKKMITSKNHINVC